MYIVEVFLEPGIDSQAVREAIWNETGAVPAIYDNGTHVAAHHRLSLELLKKISEQKGVVEITGEYDTGSWAASHEHVRHDNYERKLQSKTAAASVISFSKKATVAIETESPIKQGISEQSRRKTKKYQNNKSKYLVAAYTAAGIVGAIALAGFVISGGMPPNSSSGIQSSSSFLTTTGSGMIVANEPGLLYGYVGGLSGLPAIGSTVVAADQATGRTTSAFVSLTGQYSLNLSPGTYRVIVAFPNGVTQTVDNMQVTRGTTHELDLSYQSQQK